MEFSKYLSNKMFLKEEHVQELMQYIRFEEYKKGDYLSREGDVIQHIFFVNHGLVKMYSIDEDGKEHIIQFAPENWFVSDRSSIYFSEPSQYFIECMEACEVALISKDFVEKANELSQEFRTYNEYLLQVHILQLQNRIQLLLCANLEQKYKAFIDLYPDLALRVPQWMIASYLGVTPEGLSRVRKEIRDGK